MQIENEREFSIRRWSDLLELDWFILAPITVLILFSLMLLKSADNGIYFTKQFSLIFPAFLIGSFFLLVRIKFLESISPWFYAVSILMLLAVLFMGSSALGAQRWINLGFIKIQPSEFSKLAIIIAFSSWLKNHPIKNYFDLFASGLLMLLPFLLIFKQPDLGTALTFIAIYSGMTFWAGATITQLLAILSPLLSLIFNAIGPTAYIFGDFFFKNKAIEITATSYFVFFIISATVWFVIQYQGWKSPLRVFLISLFISTNFIIGCLRPVLWNLLQPYQQKRLTIFLNPESDPLGSGYHIIQSILAIGNGGIFGYGWLNGRLTRGSYVPAQHTDFIFSICGEEFGFIGSVIVLTLFGIVLWRILYIAFNSNNRFASLVSIGIFSYFSFHIFINIGMALGIMPITGVPLVLLSYGGTSLFVTVFSIFILLSISWRTLSRKMF